MSWGAIGGAAISVVGGALLSSDNGAQGATDSAAAATNLQAQIAREQWDRYKEVYAPLETQVVNEAKDYANPENYAKAAGDASATVAEQYGKAKDRFMRTPGLDLSSPAAMAKVADLDLSQAANDATQQNIARKGVTDTAFARKTSALGLGKGLDTTASSGLASSAATNMAMANAGNAQANGQAAAFGNVVNRVMTPANMSSFGNWLGSSGSSSNASPGIQFDQVQSPGLQLSQAQSPGIQLNQSMVNW